MSYKKNSSFSVIKMHSEMVTCEKLINQMTKRKVENKNSFI
jgi:hypothetical protein